MAVEIVFNPFGGIGTETQTLQNVLSQGNTTGGSDIRISSGDSLVGVRNLLFDVDPNTSGLVRITAGSAALGFGDPGGDVRIRGGFAAVTAGPGGDVDIQAGGSAASSGGGVTLGGGSSSVTSGGGVSIFGGPATVAGAGGTVRVSGGSANPGLTGGDVAVDGGPSTGGTIGTIQIGLMAGQPAGPARAGPVQIVSATGTLGFFAAAGVVKQVVAGAKGGNAALTSLMAALAAYGFVTDSTT